MNKIIILIFGCTSLFLHATENISGKNNNYKNNAFVDNCISANDEADLLNSSVQYKIGSYYYLGVNGCSKDYEKAYDYFIQSANQNNSNAQLMISTFYLDGIVVKADNGMAIEWLVKSANQNNTLAEYNLGMLYLEGKDIKKDSKEAYKWLFKAANKNDKSAQYNLSLMYRYGDGVEIDQKKSIEWLRKAAELGHMIAMYDLATLYLIGDGLGKNINNAKYWYIKSAQLGSSESAFSLGMLFFSEKKYEDALQNLIYATDLGNKDAMYNLALMYENGIGVKADNKKSLYWYTKAAEKGSNEAIQKLKEFH